MKENQPYDEQRYAGALENMVRQCIDYEDAHEILTEWNKWDNLVQEGYEALVDQKFEKMIPLWWKAWGIFQKIVKTAEYKIGISGLMEFQDYEYPIDAWLQDMEMELRNAGEHEKRVEFCRRILEMLDWSFDDGSDFKSAIGEELYAEGKAEQGRTWFEDWLKEEPHNQNALNVWSWCIQEEKGAEEAYKIIRREVIGVACTFKNELLFGRAKLLAEKLGKSEDLEWIKSQLETFSKAVEKADLISKRSLPLRQWEKIQEMLWKKTVREIS